jgi:glucuronoarabinoxylan endo-1,4-beta-xylanase
MAKRGGAMSAKTYLIEKVVFSLMVPLFLAGIISVRASTITIDTTTKLQAVDGFGTTSKPQWPSGNAGVLHDSLGCSIIRFQFASLLEPTTNDNSDPNVWDTNAYHVSGMDNLCRAITYYHNAYPDFKFVLSTYTPVSWMKDMTRDPYNRTPACYSTTDPNVCGGHLATNMYAEFAENEVAVVKRVKQITGVDIFALSIQNEPFFTEPYSSCVYTTDEYLAVLKIVGARFAAEGLPTKFFGAEDMTHYVATRQYMQVVLNDPVARPYLYALATHGYLEGTQPDNSTAVGWARIRNLADPYGKKVWMSETSGNPDDWPSAISYADAIYMGLKYGTCSGWIWDTDGGSSCDYGYGLLCGQRHTNRSLLSKNYYMYIRPNAVGINATAQDTSIHVVAFSHPTLHTMTIVMINKGGGKTVTLSGPVPPTFTKYTTSQTKKCLNEGSVSASSSIAIDASCAVTLMGNYTVGVMNSFQKSLPRQPGKATLYGIDGKMLRMSRSLKHAGVIIECTNEGYVLRATGM